MNVTIIQQDIILSDPAANRRKLEAMLDGLKTDLVVLPEMFSTGFCTVDHHGMIVFDDGQTPSWMQQMASLHQFAIAGSLAWKVTDTEHYNRFFFVHPDKTISYYDKRHLFTYGHEETYFSAGEERVIVRFKGFRLLLQTCYDIRFPVFSRNKGDYDAILYVANFPALRIEAWRTLIRARAIENQCYVIAVNRVGSDQVTNYNGCSAIIDAYGKAMVECGNEESIVSLDIDIQKLNVFRKRFPVGNDADKFEIINNVTS
ncbi:nitrilase-related carbon-nitrogen hydrolase [Phocaeicola oris]|uniref:nitrilase-related carbon-nitrogen hydrolase n=1 Tax=Phocaeicola oris TaxID=2896850 RepID=UPI00234F7276|nr:nitrilase-related carbon-nitrogen hydrolase [Phocaeicola oris]MCE2616042.1 nitrilase family protein [Phocaeicola oris]